MKALGALKGVTIFLIIGFAVVTFYRMARPQYDWWYCIFNPGACVQQSATDSLVNMVAPVFNPLLIIALAVAYFVLRKVSKRKGR